MSHHIDPMVMTTKGGAILLESITLCKQVLTILDRLPEKSEYSPVNHFNTPA